MIARQSRDKYARLGAETLRSSGTTGTFIVAGGSQTLTDLCLHDLIDFRSREIATPGLATVDTSSGARKVGAARTSHRRRAADGLRVTDRAQRRTQGRHRDRVSRPQRVI